MTMTLADLQADADNRRQQLTQFPSAPNPPTWVSFVGSASGFQVVLAAPVINTAIPYLSQGIGLDFPATNQNQQNQSTAAINAPTFLYQVQLATDAGFTQNLQIFDLGTSLTMTIPVTGAQFARARAKFINSSFSDWRPFGSGTATSGAVYRPFEFTSVQGAAATNPYLAMDGDPATFAVINGNGTGANTIFVYGPYGTPNTLLSGLVLSVITQVNNVDGGTSKLDYSTTAGSTYTNIYNIAGARAKTTDTVTLPNNFNVGLLRIQFTIIASNNSINVYETFAQ